ncbi:TPA: hypothetical protein ACKQC7_004798 [Serratia marcescens]
MKLRTVSGSITLKEVVEILICREIPIDIGVYNGDKNCQNIFISFLMIGCGGSQSA